MKPRTVYALVLTFEENGQLHQQVKVYSLKGNASSLQRAFVSSIQRDANARLVADTLDRLEVVPVLDDEGLFLAAHAVALTWEGENGADQTIELFERAEDAKAARDRHERAFAEEPRSGRLISLAYEKVQIIAPISEGDRAFRSYMDAVHQLQRD